MSSYHIKQSISVKFVQTFCTTMLLRRSIEILTVNSTRQKSRFSRIRMIFCVFTGTVIPRSLCKGVEWKNLFTFYFCVQRRNWRKVPWWTKISACTRFHTESETLTNAKLEKQKRETNKFLNSFSLLHVQKTSNSFFRRWNTNLSSQALQFGLERSKFEL